jgi:large subunit ribosomal protein L32
MSVRMRHTRSHTKNRRSHHSLSVQGLSSCKNCAADSMRHHACAECGMYKDRQVIDMEKKKAKKEKKDKLKETQ